MKKFCNRGLSSSYGAAQCASSRHGCQGVGDGSCWPNHLWTGTYITTGIYRGFALSGVDGLTSVIACDGTGRCDATIPFSVRCVLDLFYVLLEIQNYCKLTEC